MPNEKRGSEEPGDQILDRRADGTEADASSPDMGRSLDGEADVSSGRWAETGSEASPPAEEVTVKRHADGG